MQSATKPCLLVQLEPHKDDKALILQVVAEIVYGVRYNTTEGAEDLSFVFYAKPYAFAPCVVWCGTYFKDQQKRKRIGSFTLTALNTQYHNEVILGNYNVITPLTDKEDDSGCLMM